MRILNTAVLLIALLTAGCAKMPPDLTPMAQTAWKQTQVFKAVDLIRDTAISANAIVVPPLLDTKVTGLTVSWHRSTIIIVNQAQAGWQQIVLKSFDELGQQLGQTNYAHVAPYVVLARTLTESIMAMRSATSPSEDVIAIQKATFDRSLAIDDDWLADHVGWNK